MTKQTAVDSPSTGPALSHRVERLEQILRISQVLNTTLDLDQLLASIMDRAIVLAEAERGFLVLCDDNRDFHVAIARQFSSDQVDDAQIEISHNLIRRVLASRQPIVTTNAQEDPRFQASASVIAYQIRSVLAVPLLAKGGLIGAIYLDTRLSSRIFSDDDLRVLAAMANQAAVAIRMARLYDDLQTKNRELEAALINLREAQEGLLRAERLSVVGRMASGIIHDLKSPMTSIKGFASLLGRDDLSPADRSHFSQTIIQNIDGFVGMTQEILDYARGDSALEIRPVDVDFFVRNFCVFIQQEFAARNIQFTRDLEFAGEVAMDEGKMRRVLLNIATPTLVAIGLLVG